MGYSGCLMSRPAAQQPCRMFKASFFERVDGFDGFPKISPSPRQETDEVDFFWILYDP